jgi:hypothetical protein
MTISTNYTPDTYSGNGSTTVFAYTFHLFDQAQVRVALINDTTKVQTVQTITTEYTVSGVGESGGGNITFITAPPSGNTVHISYLIPIQQNTDYLKNADFPEVSHENALDKITEIAQQINEKSDRSLKAPRTNQISDGTVPDGDIVAKYVCRVTNAATGFEAVDFWSDVFEVTGLSENSSPADNDLVTIYDASEGTFKKVQVSNFNLVAGGQSNTASNVGVGGVGVFKQKTASDLEFKNINAGSTKITITDDTGNNEIDIDVAEANIDHDALTNFVANEHIDWTSTTSAFSTSGTAASGALTVTGNIIVTGTMDGRDIATDGTKLDGIEAAADVTDETNVTDALDGATLTAATVASADKVLIQDADDSDILKTATAQSIADLGGGGGFTQEEIEDFAGAMWTGNTEVGITVTYQDADGTIDATVSDTTVAGDTGSTGITPGDTLTIAGGTEITTAMSGDTLTINSDFTPSSTDTLTNKTFDANGTGNSLSNVDIADLANGTDGELITWDAAGAPAVVAVGTATHVLTSNGVGVAPTFQANAGGGFTQEEIEDFAGAMWTGNTETGITVTYQDADGTIDAVVSDTTVAGDSGSTGITPGDTLTIAGGTEITTAMSGDTLTINSDFTPSSTDTLTNKTFDANGTGNSLSNVDIADMANGTDGELITWDAAGAPAAVAVGTSTHVLTSNGAGAAPTFQAAAGGSGGDLVLISSATASASASIAFTGLSSTYFKYIIEFSGVVPATDDVALFCRTDSDGGASYDSGASDYGWAGHGLSGSGTTATQREDTDTADSGIQLSEFVTGLSLGTGTGEECAGHIEIHNPSDSAYTFITCQMFYRSAGSGNPVKWESGGARLAAQAVDAIQIFMSSGNIASGEFKLYGVNAA